MESLNKAAPIILVIALLGGGFYIYTVWTGGGDATEETVVTPSGSAAGEEGAPEAERSTRFVGERLVQIQGRLDRVQLHGAFFESKKFTELEDISAPATRVDFGRTNPFLPVR